MKRLQNLDVLRFLLASIVVFYHVPMLCRNQGLPFFSDAPIFNRGKEAVYMFFVLSGFLIIRLIYLAKQRDVFSIKKFYIRRILRIFPLYYLIVTFGLLFYYVILPFFKIPYENNYNLFEGILLSVFFLPNVFRELYMPGGILEVLWSIGIEEQFYIIIAPLLFFIKKNRVLKTLVILTLVYFVVFHLDVLYYLEKFRLVYFLLFSGGIVAILEEKKKLEFLKTSFVIPLFITVTTLLYFITDVIVFNTVWLNNLIIMVLFSLCIHTLAHNNFGVAIKNKTLNYFGEISYGIYMYHVIVLNAVVFIFLKVDTINIFNDTITILLIYMLTFALTLLIAHFSYTYFETYFLKLKNKFRE
ncbi:acyltransferase family protein [Ichthyenterobacterium magnum]|uniref:acyltransferase family protein n=1 Tax=Ichthyenterobacterium magnum TaxID=1230530 RepID=UPI0013C2D33B|nr:acyltransferase [Ichthyenterobacterium magnum]